MPQISSFSYGSMAPCVAHRNLILRPSQLFVLELIILWPAIRVLEERLSGQSRTVACWIQSWINKSRNHVTWINQKKPRLWSRVAFIFNTCAPYGVPKISIKVCNARWNQVTPLIYRWCGYVLKAYRTNLSGTNKDNINKLAHDFYETKWARILTSCIGRYHWRTSLNGRPSMSNP